MSQDILRTQPVASVGSILTVRAMFAEPFVKSIHLWLLVCLALTLIVRYTLVNTPFANDARVLHTLLVWDLAAIWALRVALSTVHLAVAGILLCAINLLRLSILTRCLACGGLVADGR